MASQTAVRVSKIQFGETVLQVETITPAGTEQTSVKSRVVEAAQDAAKHVEESISTVASATVGAINRLIAEARCPEQVEVAFGLRFGATGNAIVAGAYGEAAIEVRLIYNTAAQAASGSGT